MQLGTALVIYKGCSERETRFDPLTLMNYYSKGAGLEMKLLHSGLQCPSWNFTDVLDVHCENRVKVSDFKVRFPFKLLLYYVRITYDRLHATGKKMQESKTTLFRRDFQTLNARAARGAQSKI